MNPPDSRYVRMRLLYCILNCIFVQGSALAVESDILTFESYKCSCANLCCIKSIIGNPAMSSTPVQIYRHKRYRKFQNRKKRQGGHSPKHRITRVKQSGRPDGISRRMWQFFGQTFQNGGEYCVPALLKRPLSRVNDLTATNILFVAPLYNSQDV